MCIFFDESVAKPMPQYLVIKKLPHTLILYQILSQSIAGKMKLAFNQTCSVQFSELTKEINQLHLYDVVEVITLNIQQGDKHYLNWMTNA